MRLIEFYHAEKDETLVFLTSNLKLGATTIAAIYKDRWQIELFFKALKQNLKIKTFVGTTANAVKIQIWTGLIAMLLLRYLQIRSSFITPAIIYCHPCHSREGGNPDLERVQDQAGHVILCCM